ncbi:mannose-1-phosphate guanylyltransferase/mannose-6-phosphate isomerase [Cereibacter sphaeroides]|uniref:mannose-1-phosphate guanylyltransferase/mannose-6-phosphate isomerase n=1 Tax=Cereibacter sphaeroides TaxID=1063 RepID=UPI001F2B3C5E|nr:mannose-1-phosphate guanylyltransferase/mannose-6-phosphate isomerase [Cereibacter sphaeroides]MCE6949524.1 mannose-1-phosphate guanylyltransferase/mannose-6-phosphate isomerase [Cereibacter sphaeroides]
MITQILLCGGAGTRLWPLSRKGHPKQFAPILGERSLFAASAERLSGEGFGRPVIVTGADFRFVVTEQLAEVGIDPGAILIEPEPRNTAPAILAAALHVAARDPEAVLLVAPSDHAIADPAGFRAAVMQGVPAARAGRIVTFGIAPTRAETGYGWLELDDPGEGSAIPLRRFVEKPDRARAEAMLASGGFLWNSGIFLFSARTILAACEAHAPALLDPVRAAVAGAVSDLGFLRLDPGAWAEVASISIDHAVMERADNLSVVPYQGRWNDLGGWDAVALEMGEDDNGVSLGGAATAIDCRNSLLRSDSEGVELVGIGLDNIIAVAMKDAVLVADRSRAQEVKKAVEALKARGARQAEAFPHDRRPWGFFETLALGDRFQVKRILVHPGAALSLQSHVHRSEHWIVVRGTARVTVDNEVRLVTENQSVYIPLGARHRLENPGKVAMELIEVQTGSYLGEDDITRYEDIYARGQGAKG